MARVERQLIMVYGQIDVDGVQFTLDETPSTYTWDGETFLGYGVHKLTRSDDGVGVREQLVYADRRSLFAYDHFNDYVELVKAETFKTN